MLKTHHKLSSMLSAPISQREAGLVTKALGAPSPEDPFPPQPAYPADTCPRQSAAGMHRLTVACGPAGQGPAAQATPRILLGAGGMSRQYYLPGGSRNGMEHCSWVFFSLPFGIIMSLAHHLSHLGLRTRHLFYR